MLNAFINSVISPQLALNQAFAWNVTKVVFYLLGCAGSWLQHAGSFSCDL